MNGDNRLGEFLPARRKPARPEDHGTPAPGPRRVPGAAPGYTTWPLTPATRIVRRRSAGSGTGWGPVDRGFTIRLPRAADDREPPLALVLHGNDPDASGSLMREWTTFDEQADEWGLAVAYPDGFGGAGRTAVASPPPTRRESTTSPSSARSSTGRPNATAPPRIGS